MLLSDACYAYMEAKSKKLRRTTLDGYVSGLRCHVLPEWGGRELESIRRREVQEWVDGFELPGAAEKALKCLRQVIRWVIRSYDLEIFDPTQGVELPAKPVYRRESMDARVRDEYLGNVDVATVGGHDDDVRPVRHAGGAVDG